MTPLPYNMESSRDTVAVASTVKHLEREVIDLVSSSDEEDENSLPQPQQQRGKRTREQAATATLIDTERATKKGHTYAEALKKSKKTPREKTHIPCVSEEDVGEPLSLCYLSADVSETAVVTEGLVPLLYRFTSPGLVTCASQSPILHLQQTDKWSCGFRNVQMMLSALLPQLVQENHPYFSNLPHSLQPHPGSPRLIPIPSLRQVQTLLEDSWRNGFDKIGAEHFGYAIVGTNPRIGAVEVSSLFSYLSIDSVVVQFIKCHASRALLGPFCWNYFASNHENSTSPCSERAANLLQRATSLPLEPRAAPVNSDGNEGPLLPLYLQWTGHSVTIVGVERKGGELWLLVFDPAKEGGKLQQSLRASRSDSPPAIIKISCEKLMKKDCQLLMACTRGLTTVERNALRYGVNSHTAALEQVNRYSEVPIS